MVQSAWWKCDLKVKLAGLLVKLSLLFIFTDVLPSKHCLNLRRGAELRSEVIRKDFLTKLSHTKGFGAFFTFPTRKPRHLHTLSKPSPQPGPASPPKQPLPCTEGKAESCAQACDLIRDLSDFGGILLMEGKNLKLSLNSLCFESFLPPAVVANSQL